MNIKEGIIKKHIMSKIGESLMDSSNTNNINPQSIITTTYTPKATHLLKKCYRGRLEGGIVETQRVPYEEFNNLTRTNEQLHIQLFPVDCYKVEELQTHYTYYSQFGTRLVKFFQRRLFNIEEYTQVEALTQPAKREAVTVEFDVTKDESTLIDIRIYVENDSNRRCFALEERAKRIYRELNTSRGNWLDTLSYWIKTIDTHENQLLAHVLRQESLETYQGEGN